jgi:hypothetical protein
MRAGDHGRAHLDAADHAVAVGALPMGVTIGLTVDPASRGAMCDALSALAEILERAFQASRGVIDLPLSLVRAFKGDFGNLATCGTCDGRISFEPADGFRDLVSAVLAGHLDIGAVQVDERHGWPILSLRGETVTMSRRGGVRNLSPEVRS